MKTIPDEPKPEETLKAKLEFIEKVIDEYLKLKEMKSIELNPEEILKVKYSDDKWEPNFKGILEAMREFAEVYHKAKLRRELINYSVWKRKKFLAESEFTESVVDEYLNRQK